MKKLVALSVLLLACSGATGPELYYWALCEAPGMGWTHDGPYDTYREAYEAGLAEEELWRRFGVYVECEVRTQPDG